MMLHTKYQDSRPCGNVSFTHTKDISDREKTDNYFWGVIYSYVYLPLIPTFDSLK